MNTHEFREPSKTAMQFVRILAGMICLLVVLFAFRIVIEVNATPRHEDILASFPLGSKIDRLTPLVSDESIRSIEIMQWTRSANPLTKPPLVPLRMDGIPVETEFGTYMQRRVGEYSGWTALPEQRAHFTGEVSVFVHDKLFTEAVVHFVYVNGKLVKKGFGYLPG